MAIQTKKRNRLNMMMSFSSSAATTTNASPIDKKKEEEEEEYERAASFLREFHSRRVAQYNLHLHTPSSSHLDAILENNNDECFVDDEVLASDFSLALNVVDSSSSKKTNKLSSSSSSSFLKVVADVPPLDGYGSSSSSSSSNSSSNNKLRRSTSNLSRIKKTVTSKCLLDLDSSVDSNTDDSSSTLTSLSSFSSRSSSDAYLSRCTLVRPQAQEAAAGANVEVEEGVADDESDYYFGYYNDTTTATDNVQHVDCSSILQPLTKRHRRHD